MGGIETRITGWLLKLPGKAHFLGMKPWQRRYVVLDCIQSTLVYYKNEECVKANKVSGTIALPKMERVEHGQQKTDFDVHTSVERGIYSFRCATEEECNKWYNALKVYGKAFRGTDSSQPQCIKMKCLISVSLKLARSVSHVQPIAFLEAQSPVTDPNTNQKSTQWGEVGRTETLEPESGKADPTKRRFFVLLGAIVDTEEMKLEGPELTYNAANPTEYRVVVCDSKKLNKERMERPYMDGFRAAQSEAAALLTLPFTLKQLLGQPDCTVTGYFADSEDARKKHDESKGKLEKLDTGILELKFEGARECVEFSGGRVTEQSYKIPRKSGGWVMLHERLAESPFTFTVPFQLFYRMWANECMWLKKLKFAVSTKEKRRDKIKPPDEFHRVANLLADAFGMDDGKVAQPNPFTKLEDEIGILKAEIRLSSEYKNTLFLQKKLFQNYNASYLGLRFKPSVKKNDHVLAWIATNLHKQSFQIGVFDQTQLHKGEVVGNCAKVTVANAVLRHEQDTITVGAFAAHPLKFKHGGMSGCCAEIVDLRAQVAACRQVGTQVRQKLSLKLRTKEYLLDQRKAMVWSQALSALTSAFVAHLIKQLTDIMAGESGGAEILIRQQEIGFLVQVESLLSTFARERGMLEDHQYAVGRMRNTRFRCRRVASTSASQENLIRAEIVGVVLASRGEDDSMPPATPMLDREASVEPKLRNFPSSFETPSDPNAGALRPRSVWLPSTTGPSNSSRDWTEKHDGEPNTPETPRVAPPPPPPLANADSPKKDELSMPELKPYLSIADAWKLSTEEKVAKIMKQDSTRAIQSRSVLSPRSGESGSRTSPNTILFSELMDSYFTKDGKNPLAEELEDSPEEKEEPLSPSKAQEEGKKKQRVRWLSFAGVQVRSLSGHRILDKLSRAEKTLSFPPVISSPSALQIPAAIHTTGNLPDTPTPPLIPAISLSPSQSALSLPASPPSPMPLAPPPPPPSSRLPTSLSALPLKREKTAPVDPPPTLSTALTEFRPGQSDRGHLDEGCLVELLLPSFLFDLLPAALRYREDAPSDTSSEPKEFSLEFEAYPVLVTQGVNEQQSVADTINKGLREQQTTINRIAVQNLSNYAVDFIRYQRGIDKKLAEMIRSMEIQARSENNSKNLDLLHDVARSVRHMSGSRIVCCKSAKDRTSMSVTLDQYRLVKKILEDDTQPKSDVDEADLLRWLQVSRVEGVRIQNTTKNTGQRGFAFNALQRSCLPELLRPPESACGKSQPT